MMDAANCSEWERLRFVAWTYDGKRQYVWDKYYHLAEVRFDNVRVLLNVDSVDGIAWVDGTRQTLHGKRKYIARAWKYWCNDSFWLNPICKLRDDGTTRKLITLPDSSNALLVTYKQGGVTPGDSFLWIVDDVYRPVYWRMWVSILPIHGIKASWEDWMTIEDCPVSTLHEIGPYRIEIQDLRSGRHFSDLDLERDPFEDFITE
jgi:hypothetical protein